MTTKKSGQKPARLRDLERAIGNPEDARFAYNLERGTITGDLVREGSASARKPRRKPAATKRKK